MVMFGMIGQRCYLLDVVFDQSDSTYTIPLIIEMLDEYKPQYCWVESNGVGALFAGEIQSGTEETAIIDFHQSANKHAKIVQASGFIKKNAWFRSDIEANDPYDRFIDNMLLYNKNKKKIHLF